MENEKMLVSETAKEKVNSLKDIFIDMVKYMPSKLIGIIGNIIIVPIYTNLLSPEQYGLYSISIATLSFLCIIFFDWIGTAGLRFFKVHQLMDKIANYFSSLLLLLCNNLLLMFILTYIFREQITSFFKIPIHFLQFIAILIIPVSFRSLLFQILRAQIKPSLYTVSTILNQFFTIGLAITFIKYTSWGPFSILAAMAVSITVTDVALLLIVRLFSGFKIQKIQFDIIKHLCWYGMPLAVASLSMWIMTQSNRFIMQYYKGSFYNGIIGVSYNLTYSIFLTMFAIVMIAAMPRFIAMYEQKIDVRSAISKLSGYFIAMTTPFIVFISLFAADYVKLMANPKFSDATMLIPFLLVSAFFVGLADYTTIQYHLSKKTYITTIIRLIPGFIGLALNILFIPKYGLLAVGASTLLMNALYFLFSVFIVEKGLEWRFPLKRFIFTLISLAPPVLFIAFCKSYFAINGITQMLMCILLYYLTYICCELFFKDKHTLA